jgi:hypothetical protein
VNADSPQADYLKMYSMYCNNQTSAIVVLKQHMKENERLRNFLAVRLS